MLDNQGHNNTKNIYWNKSTEMYTKLYLYSNEQKMNENGKMLNKTYGEGWKEFFLDVEGWQSIKGYQPITDRDLAKVLSYKDLSRIKQIKIADLQPTWLSNAPKSVQKKRHKIAANSISTGNLEKLQWISENISYNLDGTMNIINLGITFCEDVTGIGKRCNREDAKTEAESKWYRLGSDYNDGDSQEVREASDRYRVINCFSGGKWDTVKWMEFFRDMSWCDGRYWTSTKSEDGKKGRDRELDYHGCKRSLTDPTIEGRVCAFKKMM